MKQYKTLLLTAIFTSVLGHQILASTPTPGARLASPGTGWQQADGRWYYNNADGSRQTGWIYVDDNWYYLDQNGVCAIDTVTPDGYPVDKNGAWISEPHTGTHLLGLDFSAEEITDIVVYDSPLPVSTVKYTIDQKEDIEVFYNALTTLQVSKEDTAISLPVGGALFICINKTNGSSLILNYTQQAITVGKDNTVYIIANSRDVNLYEILDSLNYLAFPVQENEVYHLFN